MRMPLESSGLPPEPRSNSLGDAVLPANHRYTRELDAGEVISQTFALYRRNFSRYLVMFLLVEGVVGVLDTLLRASIVVPTPPANLTPEETLAQLPAYLEPLLLLAGSIVIVSWIIGSLATAGAIKLTAEELEGRTASARESLRFATLKLPSVWAYNLLYGVMVFFGFLALYVPGIILAIMFSLALPAILIENSGVLDSLGRSRVLVGHRWLKTFAILLLFGIILFGAGLVVDLVGGLFGAVNYLVISLLSSLYGPLLPIFLTVYYYSNAARLTPQARLMPASTVRFCPSCGEPVTEVNQSFCRKCGNDLRPRQS